jgi:hypothetical protein
MASVELNDGEWQAVLAMMALAPWRDANPLLMKIGQQLQAQQQSKVIKMPSGDSTREANDSKEVRQ